MNGRHPHPPDCRLKPNWKTVAATAYWYAQGCSYKKIAEILTIAESTVHHHVAWGREHMELEYRVELPGAELRALLIEVRVTENPPK